MAQGFITIAGTVTGLPSGTKTISPPSITSGTAVAGVSEVALVSGDNTVAIPAGATAVVITPPSGNTIALKIKGAAGDTGILINKSMATVLSLDPAAALILNAASPLSGTVELNFL